MRFQVVCNLNERPDGIQWFSHRTDPLNPIEPTVWPCFYTTDLMDCNCILLSTFSAQGLPVAVPEFGRLEVATSKYRANNFS